MPAPFVSLTVPGVVVPSPQLMEHVWVSFVPASAKFAEAVTAAPGVNVEPAGPVTSTDGLAFATVTVAVSLTGGLTPSSAVRVTVGCVCRRCR